MPEKKTDRQIRMTRSLNAFFPIRKRPVTCWRSTFPRNGGGGDLSTLRLQSGSFVEPDLKKYYSDVLYRVKMAGQSAGYIYVTIEHQSSPDRLIGFRLMRYAIAAMQQHIAQHKSQTVPVVIPLLFYAGKTSPHPYPVDWLACSF